MPVRYPLAWSWIPAASPPIPAPMMATDLPPRHHPLSHTSEARLPSCRCMRTEEYTNSGQLRMAEQEGDPVASTSTRTACM